MFDGPNPLGAIRSSSASISSFSAPTVLGAIRSSNTSMSNFIFFHLPSLGIPLRLLVACRSFRNRAVGNSVVVVIVVGIVGVVMQRAYRARRNPLLQHFDVEFHLFSLRLQGSSCSQIGFNAPERHCPRGWHYP